MKETGWEGVNWNVWLRTETIGNLLCNSDGNGNGLVLMT